MGITLGNKLIIIKIMSSVIGIGCVALSTVNSVIGTTLLFVTSPLWGPFVWIRSKLKNRKSKTEPLLKFDALSSRPNPGDPKVSTHSQNLVH